MSAFKLHPAKTREEFEWLMGGCVFLVVGSVLVAAAGVTRNQLLYNAGRTGWLVFLVVAAVILHRWWRRVR